jgi:hypothetical protein
MNKNKTIELLEKQLPGFYSVDQVIELIKGIEGAGEGFNIPALIEVIEDHIRDQMGGMNSDDACDFSTAEFSLNGNEIQLDCVDLEASQIADEATRNLEEVIQDFLKQQ